MREELRKSVLESVQFHFRRSCLQWPGDPNEDLGLGTSVDARSRRVLDAVRDVDQMVATMTTTLREILQMHLTLEYYLLPAPMRNFPRRENLENPNHYHYALFSDNVLAYPNYKSMLNLLRFYISIIFPKLEKILLLDDDDVVVQKDLTPLWSIDLKGKTTLKEWKKNNITEAYHFWQKLNENQTLWELETLPAGLIMFYNLTLPLERKWHLLGLGYDKEIDEKEIANSAVIHFNGPLKPWKELGVTKYQPYFVGFVCLQNMADILSCYTFLL
ncbi:hypothetical protein ARALYDRAFT_346452 [Arabidopsis lyrata subsp. lyrata]|uniref:Hexosyltransferase n=1 Tax=Arabidopsis lyrata subsp. lyrata TaxID=81972 RepID=D7LEJ4_ARALL|nr:hypothetical protein ARALYDRAFT_346452 [Arabidopsis lyrata subsp. lyrata]